MTAVLRLKPPAVVYRIDQFRVPDAAYAEFLARLRETHQVLRGLPGLVDESVLEQTAGPGGFNFVTVAVWENSEVAAAAEAALAAWRQTVGFSPQEMLVRLGIETDLANYERIDA